MRRPLLNLLTLGVLGLGILAFAGLVAKQLCVREIRQTTDDLNWLRTEFRLNDDELTRIRQLHEGYIPKCRDYCVRIDAKRLELEKLLSEQEITDRVEAKLREIAVLRSECHTAMLRHFRETSRLMPPEQGKRYLHQMERLATGDHENLENRMSGSSIPHAQH